MNAKGSPDPIPGTDPRIPEAEDVVLRESAAPHHPLKALIGILAMRECYRDAYWSGHDPILADRLLWRAQSFRHTVHLLPGQSVLELGCGRGQFTQALRTVTRGENPIATVNFQSEVVFGGVRDAVEWIDLSKTPNALRGRRFDYVVAMDLLDDRTSSELLSLILDLLAPCGEVVLYESNPWNPVLRAKALLSRARGKGDPRSLVSRSKLYELISEIGFIRVYSAFNDFVFPPLTARMIWFLRNLSIVLENAPLVNRMAGSLLVHAQRPPRAKPEASCAFRAPPLLRGAVSVVVPCRNEEGNLRALTTRLLELYGDFVHEVVLVNDGSTDSTAQILDELATLDSRVRPLHRRPPNGVGRALAEGLRAAQGRYVLTMDCDFQHLLPELRDLFAAAEKGYDVVIGSRFSRHSVLLNYPFAKILSNRTFHFFARIFLRHHFRDVTNNLKLLRREVVQDLVLTQPGFAINAETGLQPYLLGYWVQEVPISWIDRTPGMGVSSFKLMKVGGGYAGVLWNLIRMKVLKGGPYAGLRRGGGGSEHR